MFKQTKKRCFSPVDALIDGKKRFMQLFDLLGWKFLVITLLVEHVLQAFIAGGGSGGLIGAPILLILSTFNLPATRMQVLETVSVSAWQLKPLIGILSDSVYIGGYSRMPFIIITSLLGIGSALALVSFYPVTPVIFVAFLFFIFLQISTSDLLLEARYVEKTKGNPATRPTLYSFVHFLSGFCQLLSTVVIGFIISYHFPLHWLYLTPVLPFFILAILVFANWTGESLYGEPRPLTNLLCKCCRFREYNESFTEHTEIPIIGMDTAKVQENWRIFLLALIIGVISVFTSMLGIFELSATYLFITSVASEIIMIISFFMLLERRIAKVLTFVVAQNMFSISLRAATFFFYTDPVEAYPEGPHFSRQFYVSVMGGLGIIVSLLAVFIYSIFMYNWRFRSIFWVTGVLFIITCIPNIFLFKRWNVAWGIPDTVFVLGSEVIQVVVGQLNSMPLGIIMLSLCAQGLEASHYSIMAGSNNIGNAFASYKGAAVLEWLDIKPSGNLSGESAQFDNLYLASTISLVIQVIPLVLTFFLIPDNKQTDDLLEEIEEEEAASGL